MFGDTMNDNANDQQNIGGAPTLNPPASDPGQATEPTATAAPSAPAVTDDQQSAMSSDFGASAQPAGTAQPAVEPAQPEVVSPSDDVLPTPSSDAANTDDLLNIKQQALQQLTPLVDHLEQTPKEEFRTTMMMIQATDNQELVKKAFDAAQKIEDDKERAQAFLDIINEINYFTQHQEQ